MAQDRGNGGFDGHAKQAAARPCAAASSAAVRAANCGVLLKPWT